MTADDDTFDLAAIDAKARRVGLSLEYLRRALAREHAASAPVTLADLDQLVVTACDLADDDVMRGAWS